MNQLSRLLQLVALPLLVMACSDPNADNPDMFYYGAPVTIGGVGTARTYLRTNGVNYSEAIGVVLSKDVLTSLPDAPTEYTLALPAEAVVTGYTHASLTWETVGHGPTDLYADPHIAVHFFNITPVQRDNITATDTAKANAMPSSDKVAANYARPSGPVETIPRMGVHWVDTTAKEFHGQPFTHTLLYGYWNGAMVVTELLITLEFLTSKSSANVPIKMPKIMPRSGTLWGTSYRIEHDATTGDIHITLENLVRK
jgi:hypothetical protein